MTGEQIAFGSGLRRERERRKITLASVADTTKIKQSLLASLERGDATQWPSGLYRRAFLREYAAAIGLSPESTLADFLRLFPESGAAAPERMDPPVAGSDLRLTLASEWRSSVHSLVIQGGAALLDGLIVLAISVALEKSVQVGTGTVIGILAVSYYTVATACLGRSPALWIVNAALGRRANLAKVPSRARPSSRDLLHIVSTTTRQDAESAQDEPSSQPFVRNARSASR